MWFLQLILLWEVRECALSTCAQSWLSNVKIRAKLFSCGFVVPAKPAGRRGFQWHLLQTTLPSRCPPAAGEVPQLLAISTATKGSDSWAMHGGPFLRCFPAGIPGGSQGYMAASTYLGWPVTTTHSHLQQLLHFRSSPTGKMQTSQEGRFVPILDHSFGCVYTLVDWFCKIGLPVFIGWIKRPLPDAWSEEKRQSSQAEVGVQALPPAAGPSAMSGLAFHFQFCAELCVWKLPNKCLLKRWVNETLKTTLHYPLVSTELTVSTFFFF